METQAAVHEESDRSKRWRTPVVLLIFIVIIAAAIIRSSIATSLESFTFDEAYHVGAGASYIKTGDFRLNPEQPPLTKLWVGAYVATLGYEMSPFRSYADKGDERDAVEEDAYFKNDPDLLQTRTRTAMFALNGLLLLIFALAVRRLFGDVMSIASLAVLAVDPTVAAHLPVMMTDLPVGLASGSAVLFAVQAFRKWRVSDVVFAALTLGVALAAKHSAVITAAVIAIIGLAMVMFAWRRTDAMARVKRIGVVFVVLAGSVVVLWSFYLFRFHETPGTNEETFNRPLATKITDLKSPVYRGGLDVITTARILPRPYVWGLADTIRAGAEGRAIPILAFGEMYYSKGPFYYFPGMIASKIPIGALVLIVLGMIAIIVGKVPGDFLAPVLGLALLAAAFLVFLMIGSSYGGVRHALPIFPLLTALAAIPVYVAVKDRSVFFGATASLSLILAIISAVPVMRPWEYFNEFVGGPAGAWKYFSDEGVDLGCRLKEMDRYYEEHLEPTGEIPAVMYFSSSVERKRRGIDSIGRDQQRDAQKMAGETFEATVFIGANELGPHLWWDVGAVIRGREPVARMGNLFVFKGTFERPKAAISRSRFYRAIFTKINVPQPDIPGAIEMLKESAELDPKAFMVSLELGNQYLKMNDRPAALEAYRKALEHAPASDSISDILREQVLRLESDEPIERITPLRNPSLE